MGGQRDQIPATWMAQFGYIFNPNWPFNAEASSIVSREQPSGIGDVTGYTNLALACLQARAVLYYKNSPGDCGTPTVANTSAESDVSTAVSLASPVLSEIPGLGSLIGFIVGIFAEHAQAVAQEEQTLCSVSIKATPAIQSIDAAVMAGAITPAQGVAAMQQLVTQTVQGLQSILKTPTDAAAYYIGVMNCHLAFCPTYYAAIAPAGVAAIVVKLESFVESGAGMLILFVALFIGVIILFVRKG